MKEGVQRIPSSNAMKHVTYERAFNVIKSFEQKLVERRYDLVLGIARSGVIPAVMISQTIDVTVAFIQCGRTQEPRFMDNIDVKGKKILLVDDIIGLGLTMRKVYDFVRNHGADVSTCCLYYDEETTQFTPDFGYSTEHFMHAQWDRKDVTPRSRQALSDKNGRCTTSDTFECFGTDLDGVFLDDINRKAYRLEGRIQQILHYRDHLKPMDNIPVINHSDVHIITARPMMDFDRTRRWLDANGFTDVQLSCRDPANYGNGHEESARFKAEQILKTGISKYFESDLLQAVLIAKKAPCTDIYWWGKKDRLRIYANDVTAPFTI